MTRREVAVPAKETLEIILIRYARLKKEMDEIEKGVKEDNAKIKSEMVALGLAEFSAGGVKASISVTEKSDFNEEQAIEIIRTNVSPDIFPTVVKTKEYLDDDALEDLIYSKKIDAILLAPCTTIKPSVITLRIGKAK